MYQLRIEPRLDPPEYDVAICPVCGGECRYLFLNINRDVICCDVCKEEREEFDSVADALYWEYGA